MAIRSFIGFLPWVLAGEFTLVELIKLRAGCQCGWRREMAPIIAKMTDQVEIELLLSKEF